MKITLLAVLFLAVVVIAGCAKTKNQEDKTAAIDHLAADIDKNNPRYITETTNKEPSTGIELEITKFRDGNTLKKVIEDTSADAGETVRAYYFQNDILLLVDESGDSQGVDSDKVTFHNRYYFENGVMIKWIDVQDNNRVIPEAHPPYGATAKRLLSWAAEFLK